MANSFQLHPGMGETILSHLSPFGALPSKGILAGQAVASAIEDLWGKGGGVYNDLDIFRQCPGTKQPQLAGATAFRSQLVQRHQGHAGYGRMALVLETAGTYGIASVSRSEMLNYVNCYMGAGHYGEKLTASRVLAGFDLNCVRVGIDLETRQLHWHRDYEQFLHSRELKISMMHTPWHTFIRLVKKAAELPDVHLNIEAAAESCLLMAQSAFINKMVRDRDVSLLFGSKHFQQAERYRSTWEPYFSLNERVFCKNEGKWTEAAANGNGDTPPEQCTLWQMAPRGTLDSVLWKQGDRLGKGILFYAFRLVEEHRRKKKSSVYVKLENIVRHRQSRNLDFDKVLYHAHLFGTEYVKGQALTTVADKVAEFFHQHPQMAVLMLGYSLAEQHAAIHRIKEVCHRFAKAHADYEADDGLGVIETQANPDMLHSAELLHDLLLRDFQRAQAPFKSAALVLPPLPQGFDNYKVAELRSRLELRQEGRQLRHCVAGYAYSVEKGRCHILRIRHQHCSENWSTAELRPYKEGSRICYQVVQHRARSNKDPAPENKAILEYVLLALNADKPARFPLNSEALQEWVDRKKAVACLKRKLLEEQISRAESVLSHKKRELRLLNQQSARYDVVQSLITAWRKPESLLTRYRKAD